MPRRKARSSRALDLVGLIRDEFARSGRTVHDVATAAGISPSVLHRLITRERSDVYSATAAALLHALGLRVVAAPRRSPRAAPPPPDVPDLSP